MTSLTEQFEKAAKHFETIYTNCTDKQKLRLYALYNQATSGDVDLKSQPSSMQMVKRAKFEARKRCIGISKEDAMKRYISELRAIDPDFEVMPQQDRKSSGKKKKMPTPASLFRSSKNPLHRSSKKAGAHVSEEEFRRVSDYVRHGKLFKDKNTQTLLYAYYKQATEGPCTSGAPRTFSKNTHAKWRSWANLFDMPKQDAMDFYVQHVKKFAPNVDWNNLGVVTDPGNNRGDDTDSEMSSDEEVFLSHSNLVASELASILDNVGKSGGLVYICTGLSGFIGTHLTKLLLERNPNSIILAVTRKGSRARLQKSMRERHGDSNASRIIPLDGDISARNFGLDSSVLNVLTKSDTGVDHFFHLAASYDMDADESVNERANIVGTEYAVELANHLHKTCGTMFHYTSSIVVAGNFNGMFMEKHFSEGQDFKNPYARTKYEGEKIVRKTCLATYRIYRPGIVVGHSQTGEASKIDGPYYFFKPIQQLKRYCPSALVIPCIEGGSIPLVPVDYVVAAMDCIAHNEDKSWNGQAFQIVDPNPPSFIETLNILSKAGQGPKFSSRLVNFAQALIPGRLFNALGDIPLLAQAPHFFGHNLFNIPESVVDYVNIQTDWDDSNTREALLGTSIRCPRFEKYAWRLWDYYVRFMDRSLDKAKALRGVIAGKTIVVTGSSDGIGKQLALRLAKAKAHVVLVARSEEKLATVKEEIDSLGGHSSIYVADLSKDNSTDKMIERVIKDHGGCDILVNNCGRSIRRSVEYQYLGSGRETDFQKCMDLNYYGSLRCILGFLPLMRERKAGQIINVSSIGAITNAPRFGAYIASKSALDAFSRCISSEIAPDNVTISTVYMPLVKTKMIISPGNKYDHMNLLTPDEAAGLIERAIVTKERKIETETGRWVRIGYLLFPSLVESALSLMYRLEPEKAPKGQNDKPTAAGNKEQLDAIRGLFKGAI